MKIESPADLAEFKHRVPDGMKVYGQPVLRISPTGFPSLLPSGKHTPHVPAFTYWTREPVKPPRPELPDAGSVILNVHTKYGDEYPVALVIALDGSPVAALTSTSVIRWLRDDEIVSFDYAFVVPAWVDVMDEEDKFPVSTGDIWSWVGDEGNWQTPELPSQPSKAAIADTYGPLSPVYVDW